MLVLFETPAGYAVFKVLDESKLQKTDNLYKHFTSPEAASNVVQLQIFEKFKDATEALASTASVLENKLNKRLKKTLKQVMLSDSYDQLGVIDAKLGALIKEKLGVNCVSNSAITELYRNIKSQASNLIGADMPAREFTAMQLGLAHGLSRYKLKFNPDKIDTMIIQAISLLDDLDKELNNYVMRCREWYGWHFPELSKIVTDPIAYAKCIKLMGIREKAVDTDFSSLLPEDVEKDLKTAAEISMGTEISEEDILNVSLLTDQIVEMFAYRTQLSEYLQNRMMAVAPNLTVLTGEIIGARLIAHAGSLLNLAKHPASTVQVFGAEKALFRAITKRQSTPKYGLMYHASLVTKAQQKFKGKISRMLAAKSAIAIRVDALREDVDGNLGIELRAKVESRLRNLETGMTYQLSGKAKDMKPVEKYVPVAGAGRIKTDDDDFALESRAQKRKIDETKTPKKGKEVKSEPEEEEVEESPKKKKKVSLVQEVEEEQMEVETVVEKKKKKKSIAVEPEEEAPTSPVKTGKKKKQAKEEPTEEAEFPVTPSSKKTKKKNKSGDSQSEPNGEAEEEQTTTPVSKKKKKKQLQAE